MPIPNGRLEIVNGPGKWDMHLAIFDSVGERRKLTFSLRSSRPKVKLTRENEVYLEMIGPEDGSSETFLVHVRTCGPDNKPYQGCYNTRDRSGFLDPVEK